MTAALLEEPTPMGPVIYYPYPVCRYETSNEYYDYPVIVGTAINREDNFKSTFYYYGILFNEYCMTSCVSLPVVITFIM